MSAWTIASSAALLASATSVSADGVTPICTDRPTQSNHACVVEPGRLRYESDVVDVSHLEIDGVTTDVHLATNPTFKYGVAQDVDVEVDLAPWTVVHTRDDAGRTTILRGPGDLDLRAEWNVASAFDARLTATLLPQVKVPTARRGLGVSQF